MNIEMTFLAVPKAPDPLDCEFFVHLRISALKYLRKHPECFADKWWKLREAARVYRTAHPESEPAAAPMTDAEITNFIANVKCEQS